MESLIFENFLSIPLYAQPMKNNERLFANQNVNTFSLKTETEMSKDTNSHIKKRQQELNQLLPEMLIHSEYYLKV